MLARQGVVVVVAIIIVLVVIVAIIIVFVLVVGAQNLISQWGLITPNAIELKIRRKKCTKPIEANCEPSFSR